MCFNEWDKNASSSGPSKRDKHVLPATSYGKANSRISSSPVKSKERRQEVDKGFFSSTSCNDARRYDDGCHVSRPLLFVACSFVAQDADATTACSSAVSTHVGVL